MAVVVVSIVVGGDDVGASVVVVDSVVELSVGAGARLVTDAVVAVVESEVAVVVVDSDVVVEDGVVAAVDAVGSVVETVVGGAVVNDSLTSGRARSEETSIVDVPVFRPMRATAMTSTAIAPTATGRTIPPCRTRSTIASCDGAGGV